MRWHEVGAAGKSVTLRWRLLQDLSKYDSTAGAYPNIITRQRPLCFTTLFPVLNALSGALGVTLLSPLPMHNIRIKDREAN